MEYLNIVLPQSIKDYVLTQVAERGYRDASEYLQDLIRADQHRKSEELIDDLLVEGLDSGPPQLMTTEYWEAKKNRLVGRFSKNSGTEE